MAREIENDNPFDTYTIKPDAATGIREKYPILIPSTESSRVVEAKPPGGADRAGRHRCRDRQLLCILPRGPCRRQMTV